MKDESETEELEMQNVMLPLMQFHAVKNSVKNFLAAEDGATAIEYGLIAAGISVAIVVVVTQVGSKLENTFTAVSDNLVQ